MAVSEVTVDELESALQSGAPLIDVREIDEYHAGHVPGAVLVPLATVPSALDRFPTDQRTYVICKSGARSHRACEFLVDQGRDVVNVAGGTLAWISSGRATVDGDQPA
jgi:rhodanese-related sulfurtransferase